MTAMTLLGWGLAASATGCATVLLVELGRRAECVARAVHEVRGPLGAAALALHAVGREGEAPAVRVAGVELEILRAGLALDDLLPAHVRAGRSVSVDTVDVAGLLACQVDTWAAVARARGTEVRLQPIPRGAVVQGDRVRLAQATANLIANAIEHGLGPVELSAVASAGCVRIDVADRGPGLPASVSELARRPKRGRGSRGRGIAIASEIAARHGGRLAVSAGAAGTRLSIELPAAGQAA